MADVARGRSVRRSHLVGSQLARLDRFAVRLAGDEGGDALLDDALVSFSWHVVRGSGTASRGQESSLVRLRRSEHTRRDELLVLAKIGPPAHPKRGQATSSPARRAAWSMTSAIAPSSLSGG